MHSFNINMKDSYKNACHAQRNIPKHYYSPSFHQRFNVMITDLSLYYHNLPGAKHKNNAFHPSGWQRGKSATSRHGHWSGAADTHVLVRADQEAVMNVSLHQTGLPHTLLSQHHHFGVHAHCTHSKRVWKSPGRDRSRANRREGGVDLQGRSVCCVRKRQDTQQMKSYILFGIYENLKLMMKALKTMTSVFFQS